MSRRRQHHDRVKRLIDIVGAGVGLTVLSPAMAVLWFVVRKKLGSPVIFTQQRAGKDGREFTLYKFRTMLELDPERGIVLDDQRMTSFGRRLRSTSLDELPTLINVLKGDMSLVGPRPLHMAYLPRYSAHQARRHEVRPGVTGLAQVMGRNSLNWDERFDLDVQYVDERTLLLDIKIIAQTFGRVFSSSDVEAEGISTMPAFTGSDPQDGLAERLMTEQWHEVWTRWQQDPRSIKSIGAETTHTGSARYWMYVDQDENPVCIAGLSGLGGTEINASILANPEWPDPWFLPAVLKRLQRHGPVYKADRIMLPATPEETVLRDAAHDAGFIIEQPEPANSASASSLSTVLTLALASEMRT